MSENQKTKTTFDVVKIGDVEIEKTAVLAPMASIADRAYRILCREYGASYVVSEMISAKGMCYSDRKTEELCRVLDSERPCALQLFGDEPEFMGKATKMLADFKPNIIDINMGCPVPKVAGNGAGSALMKNPEKASEIVKATVLSASCPVTVKIRAGWDKDSVNAVEFAKMLEASGASAIAVHGRTKTQMYSGFADWEIIAKVKNAVSIPVFGNGDVKCGEDCKKMYEQTGCDLVMIGRGSYGRPWVFKQVRDYLADGTITPEPPLEERVAVMLRHAKMMAEFKGERQGIREARRIVSFYLKGVPRAAQLRNLCGGLETIADVEHLAQLILTGEKQL